MFPSIVPVRIILMICMIGSCGKLYLMVYSFHIPISDKQTSYTIYSAGAMIDTGIIAARVIKNITDNGQNTSVLALTLPLLITNVVATALIGYKAW